MKSVYVFWNRIKQYYLKNKGIFLLFMLGGMLNAIIVLYCYGNVIPLVANRYVEGYYYMEYLALFENTPPSLEAIQTLRKDPLIRGCIYHDENNVYAFHEDYPIEIVHGSSEFTGPYQVIVPPIQGKVIGERIDIYGKEFEIIGISSFGYYIPESTFLELIGMEDVVTVNVYASKRQYPENDRVDALIRKTFPNMEELSGQIYATRASEARDYEAWMTLITVQAFAAVLAYAFLLRYMLKSLKKENVVCLILGASKLQTAIIIFRDALSLSVLANAAGLVAHRILYKPVFQGLNVEKSLRYNINDYCLILLMMVLLSLIVAVPVVLQETVSTPLVAKRRNL